MTGVEDAAPQRMRVDTRLVREQLVGRILDRALERVDRLGERAATDLAGALARVSDERAEPSSPEAIEFTDRLARLGYACREAEAELFEAARVPSDWLAERMHDGSPLELAAELARSEPEPRPDPGEAPSWRVPGPGGHVRHYLVADGAARLAATGPDGEPRLPNGLSALELKRCWMLGFFLRCCEETAPRSDDGGDGGRGSG